MSPARTAWQPIWTARGCRMRSWLREPRRPTTPPASTARGSTSARASAARWARCSPVPPHSSRRCGAGSSAWAGPCDRPASLPLPACHALDRNWERLADDHANAALLADALARIDGVSVEPCETNILFFDVGGTGRSAADIAEPAPEMPACASARWDPPVCAPSPIWTWAARTPKKPPVSSPKPRHELRPGRFQGVRTGGLEPAGGRATAPSPGTRPASASAPCSTPPASRPA